MANTIKDAILDDKRNPQIDPSATQTPAGTTDGTGTTEVTQTPSELDRLSETKYDINYDDTRFQQVQSDKNAALNEIDNVYQGMIDQSDNFYQAQIDASKQWAEQQSQLQQEKSDFAIDQIEQQKAQAQQDYTKEQSGAYVDWQKQSNQYGVNAEQMAAAGMANTGYSESSQVAMYNTYQNRVATARESLQKAVLNYNNSITEARLHNNSLLAEIAYNSLQQQLELSLQGFQYKNNLLLEKAAQRLEVENMYYNRYQDVLAQINQEFALAEQIRQFNETMAEEKRQFGVLNPEKETFRGGSYGGGGSYSGGSYSGSSGSGSSKSNNVSFDYNTDYQALIDDAIAKGNTALAAKYEAQRNAKIDAMNKNGTNSGGYTKTNIYTGDGSLKNPGGNTGGNKYVAGNGSTGSTGSKDEIPLNTQSVINLGHGPINDEKAVQLVLDGKAEYVNINGTDTFIPKSQNVFDVVLNNVTNNKNNSAIAGSLPTNMTYTPVSTPAKPSSGGSTKKTVSDLTKEAWERRAASR